MPITKPDIQRLVAPAALAKGSLAGTFALPYYKSLFTAFMKSLPTAQVTIIFSGTAGTGVAAPSIGMPGLTAEAFVALVAPLIPLGGMRPNFGHVAAALPTTRYLIGVAEFITWMSTNATVTYPLPAPVGVGTGLVAVPGSIVMDPSALHQLILTQLLADGFGDRGSLNDITSNWHRILARGFCDYLRTATPSATLLVTGSPSPTPAGPFPVTGPFLS